MVDKNLFPYDLAIVAIFKNEAPYLQEWLDYHLLAGVDHFYLYNNDSTDNFVQVLAPYVDANLVTLTDFPGKAMQMLAYENVIEKFREVQKISSTGENVPQFDKHKSFYS